MKSRYLEVTYRKGKPLAAYLYLARQSNDVSAYVESAEGSLRIDRTADGRAIGIEIVDPAQLTIDDLNQVLQSIGQEPITPAEIAPLTIAA